MARQKIVIFIVLFSFFLVSCSSKTLYVQKTFLALGTFVEVKVPSGNDLQFISKFLSRYDQMLNLYDPRSELSLLNAAAGKAAVEVSAEMLEILQLAKKYYEISDGIFDPSAGRVFLLWKDWIKQKDRKDPPARTTIEYFSSFCGMEQVVIEEKTKEIFIKNKEIVLDFGGIAKGFVVGKLVQELRRRGLSSFLVSAGGQVYASGFKDNARAWVVGIKNPLGDGAQEVIFARDQAIATSGSAEQFVLQDGTIYSHIINPKTGYPAQGGLLSVTVIAPDSVAADVFSTVFFILGKEKSEKFIQERNLTDLEVAFIASPNEYEKALHVEWYPRNPSRVLLPQE